MRTVYIHLHIPKCGGSTVLDLLKRNFRQSLMTTNSILNNYHYSANQISQIIDNYPRLRCLTGHKISLDLPFEREDLQLICFTWIRNPIDRFISHYFYHRNHTENVPQAKSMDLKEYIQWALVDGNQKAYINGQVNLLTKGGLEHIKSLVQNGNLHVFPLDSMQESMYFLSALYPNDFKEIDVVIKNVSEKYEFDYDEIYDLVLPFVQDDMYLLELANKTLNNVVKPVTNQLESTSKSKHNKISFKKQIFGKSALTLRKMASYFDRLA
ncbi:MAG: sulfotransferase family 2 domain-containing protein [Chitinophagales bacterium]